MLDAYTVRKAVPRILLAAIGINISIYICVAAVDITNILGGGMARLLASPFTANGLNAFDSDFGTSSYVVGGVGAAVGGFAMTGAVSTAIAAVQVGGIGVITGALSALFFLLIPVMLLALAILCVVVIRQALLFFLIVVSPVAIACFVLPGTEKYFQKWMDLFIKTLLVYPIIAIMFALSDVFASIIFGTNAGTPDVARIITGIVVIYAPLFMIPFAFKLAGGAIAQVARFASGAGDKINQAGPIKGRREHYAKQTKENMIRGGAAAYKRAAKNADASGRIGKRVYGFQARRIAGYKADILDRESALNKAAAEHTQETAGYGEDRLQRAYTADREASLRDWARGTTTTRDDDGNTVTTSATGMMRERRDDKGKLIAREYQTAGGAWATESAVDEAERKYGKRNFTQYQASMAYEMKKANTQEQQDNLVRTFGEKMDSWGASGDEANGAWIGAGFANQEKNRQWKHGRWGKDKATGRYVMSSGGQNLISEYDEAIGPYAGGNSNADTWVGMAQQVEESAGAVTAAQTKIDALEAKKAAGGLTTDEQANLEHHTAERDSHRETLKKASRIVNSIRTKQVPRDNDGNPIPNAPPIEMIGQGAIPHTQEAMRNFAAITDHFAGVYEEPSAASIPPSGTIPGGSVTDGVAGRSGERRK